MEIAFFDFDGTISRRDSFLDFLLFAVGWPRFLVGVLLLGPTLIGYLLGLVPNWRAKEMVLDYFFKGWNIEAFQALASRYSRERLPRIVKDSALQRISWHQAAGHRVAVVSAALESWLQDWCEMNGLDLIATRIEVKDGKITGRLAGLNCYGEEKVRRIRERYNLAEFHCIYAYGDSRGDKEMLALANYAYKLGS